MQENYGMTALKRIRSGFVSIVLNIVMLTFSISCIYPLVWIFYSSFKLKREFNADIVALPPNPTLENYRAILVNPDYHIRESMVNSTRTTAISVALIVLFGFVLGYFIARVRFPGKRVIWLMLLAGMLIPVHSLMVPIYIVFNQLGMTNRWFTLIIPYVAFGLPIAVFLVTSYLRGIPTELEEAASIDGSSFSRTMFSIIMPICRPVMITIAIIQTFACWNEFSFALVLLRDSKLHTVPLAMTQFTGQFASDYPKIMAAMIITMSPIILLYFGFSGQIIKGMVSGVVKG